MSYTMHWAAGRWGLEKKGGVARPLKAGRMDESLLLIDIADAVATITINRPRVRNALNRALLAELARTLGELDTNPDVGAIVLTGAGETAFAAGADIGELAALGDSVAGTAQARSGQAVTLIMERMRTPIIAAINGFALGGGCELAMAADIRIASATARFGQPEVNLGLIAGYGGTQRLARLTGRGMAMLLCLTGEIIDAAEALRIGLVERVVAPSDLLATARRIALLIVTKAPLAVAATKRAIDEGSALPMTEALALEALHFGTVVGSADFREGTRAFLDKRDAVFRGA